MATFRAGKSTFWSSILSLFDTEDVTHETLYTQGIDRLIDRTVWLLDEGVRDRAALAKTTAGTVAKVTGSVDLGTVIYDDIAGDLNGLTLQVQTNTSGVITVTFGVGEGFAPTSPSDVVAAILAASSGNPGALLDSAGHLTLSSATASASGTVTIVGGSAVTLLGFVVAQTATGASSGGDGASIVGVAATTGTSIALPSGTLRSVLQYLADNIGSPALPIVSRSVTRVSHEPPILDDTVWINQTIYGMGPKTTANAAADVFFPFKPPHGQVLTSVKVYIRPVGGHSGLPSTMPQAKVLYSTIAAGTPTQIGATTVDTSADTTAYQTAHAITVGSLGHTIDTSSRIYYLQLTSEGGTNAIQGMRAYGVEFTFTRDTVGEY
jgi:hypothetical protein